MSNASADARVVAASVGRARGTRSIAGAFRRLARMPLSEIAGRGRQEAAKLVDRLKAGDRVFDPHAILEAQAPALARPGQALDVLRRDVPRRFFAGVEDPSRVCERLPAFRSEAIASAEAALHNRFDLLGYRTLWFGDPIDWHLDPVWSRRAPRVHWTEVDPLDPGEVGDSKIVWELNRHQWVARLAQAYALTGDERFARRALGAIESWIDANPYGIGVNWASSLEAAYRIMSWAWTVTLLRESQALTGDRLVPLLAALWQHARYVARFPSYYFSPNTHLTGEALGLFYAGALFPEFRQARRWREIGARVLVAESRSQLTEDGMHFERSTCYHRYTVETYQQFLLLADRNGVPLPPDLSDRVRQMVDVVMALRRPDGLLPEIGDADGGRLMPLVERPQCDPAGVLAVGATMSGRGDVAWAAGGLTAEVAWLMGEEGVRRFTSVAPAVPARSPSCLLPAGGYAVMATGWDRDAHQMAVDAGPLGCHVSGGHGHADLLSLRCSAFGEPVLVDAGTYCYTPEPEWRNFFRGTAAHSTLMVDGRDQADAAGPFSWQGRPRVSIREWRTNARCDFVDASHTAYPGLVHRRRVLFVKPDYWVVVDEVTQTAARGSDPLLEVGFQCAPMTVDVVRDRWARARTPGGNTFWMAAFGPGLARPAVKTGETAPIRGWVSADYGQRTPAPLVVFAAAAPLPWRAITLLIPQRGARSAPPAVSVLVDDHHLPIGLELEDRRESIFVDETDIFTSVDR